MALIQCPLCGKQVSDRAKNCIHCGASLAVPPPAPKPVQPPKPTYTPPVVTKPAEPVPPPPPVEQPVYTPPPPPPVQPPVYAAQPHHRLVCPKCGGVHLQVSNDVQTVGKNYNAATGCLGWLIAGPIGLLCGLCGANKRTRTKTYWKCTTCGHSFMDEKTLREELKVINTSMWLMFILGGIAALAFLLAGFSFIVSGDEDIGLPILLCSLIGFGWGGIGLCYVKPRKNLIDELKQNFGVDP